MHEVDRGARAGGLLARRVDAEAHETLLRELDRVAQEVDQDLHEARLVREEVERARDLEVDDEFEPLQLALGEEDVREVAHELAEREVGRVHADPVELHEVAVLEDVRDLVAQPAAVLEHDAQLLLDAGADPVFLEDRLHLLLRREHGRAQVVRHGREDQVLELVRLLQVLELRVAHPVDLLLLRALLREVDLRVVVADLRHVAEVQVHENHVGDVLAEPRDLLPVALREQSEKS